MKGAANRRKVGQVGNAHLHLHQYTPLSCVSQEAEWRDTDEIRKSEMELTVVSLSRQGSQDDRLGDRQRGEHKD
jgi:hypothetical protein